MLVVGYFVWTHFTSEDYQARKTAEKYMDSVRDSGDSGGYLDIGVEGFIDVFDYEYLDTMDIEREKNIREFNTEDYENEKEYMEDTDDKDSIYYTYQKYKDFKKEIYNDAEVIEDDIGTFVVWDKGDYKDQHKFLYNVEIANGAGKKIFKKAEIFVEEILDEYRVTDIFIR